MFFSSNLILVREIAILDYKFAVYFLCSVISQGLEPVRVSALSFAPEMKMTISS